jgi:hypothetical protein
MRYFFSCLCLLFGALSCMSSKKAASAAAGIEQGVEGFVREEKGNLMPSPDRELPPPKGVSTTVYVYELTNVSQTQRVDVSPFYQNISTRLVQSVMADSSGYFAVSLPPGDYSLFTKVKGVFYANNFDGQNNIAPVKVEEKKVSKVNILISADAVY